MKFVDSKPLLKKCRAENEKIYKSNPTWDLNTTCVIIKVSSLLDPHDHIYELYETQESLSF